MSILGYREGMREGGGVGEEKGGSEQLSKQGSI